MRTPDALLELKHKLGNGEVTNTESCILFASKTHAEVGEKAAEELSAMQARIELLEGLIFRNCDTMDMTKSDEEVAQEIYTRLSAV